VKANLRLEMPTLVINHFGVSTSKQQVIIWLPDIYFDPKEFDNEFPDACWFLTGYHSSLCDIQ